MTMYHIRRSGEPGVCKAKTPESCPLSGRDSAVPGTFHTDDREKVEAVAEILNEHEPGYKTRDGIFFENFGIKAPEFLVDSEGNKHYVMNSLFSRRGKEGLKEAIANSLNDRLVGGDPRYHYMSQGEIENRVDLDALVTEEARVVDKYVFIPYEPDDLPDEYGATGRQKRDDLVQKYTRNGVDALYRTIAWKLDEEFDIEKHRELGPSIVRSHGFEALRYKKRRQKEEYESLNAERADKAREIRDKMKEISRTDRLDEESFERAINNDGPLSLDSSGRLLFYQINFIERGNVRLAARDDGYETPEQLFGNDKQAMEEAQQLKPMIKDYRRLSGQIEDAEVEMLSTDLDYRVLSRDAVEYFSGGYKDKAREYKRYFGIE